MSQHFGNIAVIGKPNVGKSTIVNAMVGQKVSIVSNKPQTTRRKVMGIMTRENFQVCLMDTPGIHEAHTVLGREMLDAARAALSDVSAVLYVADVSHHPGGGDKRIADLLKSTAPELPVLLALNKMDLLKADRVIPHVESYCEMFGTEKYMLTVANRERNLDKLEELILSMIPEGEFQYEADDFTDQPAKFMAAEIVREKILDATRQELPYATAVLVDEWEQDGDLTRIRATVLVEKSSQRAILLGKGGSFIKELGTAARIQIEELIGNRVFLELYVKVEEQWRMNTNILADLDYSR